MSERSERNPGIKSPPDPKPALAGDSAKLPSNQSEKPRAVALIGFCTDENSSFLHGAAKGPPLIRRELFSAARNLWTEGGIDLGREGILDDAGDISSASPSQIEDAVSSLMAQGRRPLALGGDHSITFPIVRAIAREYSSLSILHFDAHPDLYHDFRGNPFSHASPFARIMEAKLAQRLVQVGIRTMNAHQREQAERFGVEVIEMKNIEEGLALMFDTPVYVSVDIDALDPAFAPGVVHREPGGLSTRQLIEIIQSINAPVIGADIVEFNPELDPTGMTAVVCAKILKELAGKMLTLEPVPGS
ncbi:MAG TPA: agmatinase [Pyrinomonadaceae bacterium]|nr:agmatinase [Pyrinomonadaceae bacterium]